MLRSTTPVRATLAAALGLFAVVALGGCSDDPVTPAAPASATAAEPAGPDIPPPLTAAQIEGMSKQELLEMLQRVSAARRHAQVSADAPLRDRLKRDADLLLAKIKDAPSGAAGAGASDEPPTIPAALDEETVAAMTKPEALEALAVVVKARRWARTTGDQELSERLKRDFDLLMQHVRDS